MVQITNGCLEYITNLVAADAGQKHALPATSSAW